MHPGTIKQETPRTAIPMMCDICRYICVWRLAKKRKKRARESGKEAKKTAAAEKAAAAHAAVEETRRRRDEDMNAMRETAGGKMAELEDQAAAFRNRQKVTTYCSSGAHAIKGEHEAAAVVVAFAAAPSTDERRLYLGSSLVQMARFLWISSRANSFIVSPHTPCVR